MQNPLKKPEYEYNSLLDVLYIRVGDAYETYSSEKQHGILINIDYETNEIMGADIWDFKKRIESKESVELPFEIDLRAVYASI